MELKIKEEIADYLDENVMSKKKIKKISKLLYNKEAIEKEIDNYENKINELEKENQKYINKIDKMKEKNKDKIDEMKEKIKSLENDIEYKKGLIEKRSEEYYKIRAILNTYRDIVKIYNPEIVKEKEGMR